MLRNNTVMKIISLLFAIILWMYVMGEVNPTTTQTIEAVPVELLNVDTLEQRDLAIQGNDSLTVDVVVTGKRAQISSLHKDDFKATANLFGYEQGKNQVPVQVEPPDGITLAEVKPSKVEITLEELVSMYKPINVVFTGKTESGTEPGHISSSPTEIEIKGAKSTVNSVSYVQAKVRASRVTDELQTFAATPVAVDEDADPVYGVELSAKTVDVEAVLYQLKTVPLKVDLTGKVASAYEVISTDIPEEITIRGPKAQVAGITSVKTAPIDISGVTASTTLPVKPILPSQVEVGNRSKNIGVVIKIRGLTTRTLSLSTADSDIQNLGDGLSAYINTAEVKVKVAGNEEIINSIDNNDFNLSIDLKGLSKGTHTVPITVTCGEPVESMKIQPQKVEITINKE